MINVIIIGPSITKTKGGMATVINDMLESSNAQIRFTHLVSHEEGRAGEKISRNFKAVTEFVSSRDIDLVHIHVASGASLYRKSMFVLLSRLRGIPVVIHVHGADFDSFYFNSSALAKWYIRKTFALCQKILVLSGFWKKFFLENITDKNVEVLHNGVYTQVFAACYTMPANLNKFLFLGRLGQRKGVYDLLEAVEILVNKQNYKDLVFYLAGDGDIDQVRNIIADKRLEQNVKLLGWIGEKEKLEWLKQADTMILPSYNEGLPMSILESMAAGKIIISGRVGGIPDLVTEGENGFLITPGDIQRLCQHIVFVATNPQRMLTIAQNNQQKINKDYNLEKLNAWLHTMYNGLVNAAKK